MIHTHTHANTADTLDGTHNTYSTYTQIYRETKRILIGLWKKDLVARRVRHRRHRVALIYARTQKVFHSCICICICVGSCVCCVCMLWQFYKLKLVEIITSHTRDMTVRVVAQKKCSYMRPLNRILHHKHTHTLYIHKTHISRGIPRATH